MPLWNNNRNNYQYGNTQYANNNGNSGNGGFLFGNRNRMQYNNNNMQYNNNMPANNRSMLQGNRINQPMPQQMMRQQPAPQQMQQMMRQQPAPQQMMRQQPVPQQMQQMMRQQPAPQQMQQPVPQQMLQPGYQDPQNPMQAVNPTQPLQGYDPGAYLGGPVENGLPVPQDTSQIPVQYEPLDETTMEEVRRIIAEKSTAPPLPELPVLPQAAVGQPAVAAIKGPEMKTTEDSKDGALREFIQNERNASLFYKYLSTIASKEDHSRQLNTLSDESAKRSDALNGLYKNIYGREYDVKKTKINNSIKFREGISWAINVENKALREISDYYEKMDNESHCRKINAIIHKKLCDLSCLQSISSGTRSLFS